MTDYRRYRHLIWDWNGTLLDDAWLCVDVMNGMLAERGLPLRTVAEYRDLFDFPVKEYYVKLGYDFEKESFDFVGMEFIRRYNKRHFETTLHPQVTNILEHFINAGYTQHILSAREQNELQSEIRKLNVDHFFTNVRGLDDHYAHGKTEIGLQLMTEIGALPETMLFIGDTRHDAEVAREMGIDCVLIPNGHHSRDRLITTGLPVIDDLDDLTGFLIAADSKTSVPEPR
jgi:phosphoglycolate phosphatase